MTTNEMGNYSLESDTVTQMYGAGPDRRRGDKGDDEGEK